MAVAIPGSFLHTIDLSYRVWEGKGGEGEESYSYGENVQLSSHNASALLLTGALTLCISESLAGVPALPPGGGIWTHTPTWGDSGFWACQTEGSFLFADEEDACPLGRGKLDEWLSQDSGSGHAADSGMDSDSHPASVQPSRSEGERFQGCRIDKYTQKLGANGRERKEGMNGETQQQLLLKAYAYKE